MSSATKFAVVIPVLDDWAALKILIEEIDQASLRDGRVFDIYAVDDGSTEAFTPKGIVFASGGSVTSVEVIHLALNLGHQRAIAVGLCALASRTDISGIIVMDGDGEDKASDISNLIDAGKNRPGEIIFAGRMQRSESSAFKFGYLVYKLIFRALTGRSISFGNFSFIPLKAVRRLVHMPELWNNLPASIIRSRIPYHAVPTARGRRYFGRSRLGLVGLVTHGLSALSVYTDLIFALLLMGSAFIAVAAIIGLVLVASIRFTTDLAIPGWASGVAGNLVIILMLTVVVVVATCLMMLAGRSFRPIIPIIDALAFIESRERCDREP